MEIFFITQDKIVIHDNNLNIYNTAIYCFSSAKKLPKNKIV